MMRSFILAPLVIMFYFHVQAQERTPVYEQDTTIYGPQKNEFTVITKQIVIGEDKSGNTLTVYFQKRRTKGTRYEYTHYICLFSELDLGCSGTDENYIKIKLESGENIKLDKDLSEINCKPPVESTYLLEDEIFEKLKTNKIISLRLKQSKYYADFNIWYPDVITKIAYLLRTYR
jgi:hypothetical protein